MRRRRATRGPSRSFSLAARRSSALRSERLRTNSLTSTAAKGQSNPNMNCPETSLSRSRLFCSQSTQILLVFCSLCSRTLFAFISVPRRNSPLQFRLTALLTQLKGLSTAANSTSSGRRVALLAQRVCNRTLGIPRACRHTVALARIHSTPSLSFCPSFWNQRGYLDSFAYLVNLIF